jgi:hypothetical protein
MNTLGAIYLDSAIKRFLTYKTLGDMTFAQLEEKDFFYAPSEESNSIAVIIQHLHGNMISRWTNFLTEDGEKAGRNRDEEFSPPSCSAKELVELWEKGWRTLIDTLTSLKEEDLLKTITIRQEPHIVIDAINRQLAHYPHHVGQIVYLGKMIRDAHWRTLSIARGASHSFNKDMKQRFKQ